MHCPFKLDLADFYGQHSGVGEPVQNVRHLRPGHGEEVRESNRRNPAAVSLFISFHIIVFMLCANIDMKIMCACILYYM